jgi:hypothetical protein
VKAPGQAEGGQDSVITGWHAWQIGCTGAGDPLLVSVPVHNAWETGGAWTESVQCYECRQAENAACLCGMVALDELPADVAAQNMYFVGQVELRGNVRRVPGGWRADQARPIEIQVPGQWAELAPSYAQTYGCPVRLDVEKPYASSPTIS